MESRYIILCAALPQVLPRLFPSPTAKTIKELVVMASVTNIHLSIPEKVVLGMFVCEPLKRHMQRSIRAVDFLSGKIFEWGTKDAE